VQYQCGADDMTPRAHAVGQGRAARELASALIQRHARPDIRSVESHNAPVCISSSTVASSGIRVRRSVDTLEVRRLNAARGKRWRGKNATMSGGTAKRGSCPPG